MVRFTRVLALALTFMLAQVALAKKGALIDYKDGKTSPQLAKTAKKIKDGEYEFELDLAQKVQGKSLDAAMVKATLEKKLAKKYGVAVTAKSGAVISIAYTTDEVKFLEKIAKTKIRANNVELAMEGNVSDGGLRADEKVRPIVAKEVVATIVMLKGTQAKVKVIDSKSTKIKGGVVTINLGSVKAEKGHRVIFTPAKKKKGVWTSSKTVEVFK